MSRAQIDGLLLRCYPRAWRDRYGEELQALIVEMGDGQGVSWRIRLDVALAGVRARVHGSALGRGGPAGERVRRGSLLVLWAWTLFVVAGSLVQKLSEHWQRSTAPSSRPLLAGAFDALVVAACVGSALVLVGVAVTIPSLLRFLGLGGWSSIRRPLARAALLTATSAAAGIGIVVWAGRLVEPARNGHDAGYELAVVAWGVLIVAALIAWVAAATAISRRLELSRAVLRLEARLATGVTAAIVVMTAAAAIWWATLAAAAPRLLAGRPVDSSASSFSPQVLIALILMLTASALAGTGTARAVGALPRIGPDSATPSPSEQ